MKKNPRDKEKMSEEARRKISEKQKAIKHTWHTGKKLDADKFIEGFQMWRMGKISGTKYAKYVGLGYKAGLNLRLKRLKEEGVLNGDQFTDGKPVYYNLVPSGFGELMNPVLSREKL